MSVEIPTTPARTIDPAERRDIIVGILLAMFLAALDQTIIAPALPTIGASLDLPGAVLVIMATTTLTLVLTWGGSRFAWASPQVVALSAVSLIFWALFCGRSGERPAFRFWARFFLATALPKARKPSKD
jgi:MFS family permease